MAEPICPYFGECGGCSTQHIGYALQLENKKKTLGRAVACNDINNIKVFSGNPCNYRNRMDFIFHSSGLGLRKNRKWQETVDIERCAISDERLNTILKEIRDFFSDAYRAGHIDHFDIKKNTGTFRYAVIRAPQHDSSVSFVLNSGSARLEEAAEKIKKFAEITSAGNVLITYVPPDTDMSISDDFFVVKGKDMLKETYMGRDFEYSAQGFFQNNSEMAEKMQEYCNGILKKYGLEKTKKAHLLDLYGGVGTFGIINADLFSGVTIVENVKQCIDAANRNIGINGIKNAKAVLLDAAQLRKLSLPKPLFVITDPPRSGMHLKTIRQLNELKPEVIIYVSCNPEQLGKDIPKFKGYLIKSAALFDLFPQTNHAEGVVELILDKKSIQ